MIYCAYEVCISIVYLPMHLCNLFVSVECWCSHSRTNVLSGGGQCYEFRSLPNFLYCLESRRRSIFDRHKRCLSCIIIWYINILSIIFRHHGKVYDLLTGNYIFLIPADLALHCYEYRLAHRTSGASKCGKRERIVRHSYCLKSDK